MLGGILYLGHKDEERPSRSTQVEITFGDQVLYFIGLRLGYLHFLTARETENALKELGPELLDRRMTKARFVERIGKRRGALKTTLVNQQVVAGSATVMRMRLPLMPAFTRCPKSRIYRSSL